MTISLEKRIDAATASLQRIAQESPIDLGDVCAQVDLAADRSGSARKQWPDMYEEAVERAVGLSMTGLDDDQRVPGYVFDHRLVAEKILTPDNYKGWITHVHATAGHMGRTLYTPVLARMLASGKEHRRFSFGKSEADEPPFLHLFCTDGAPNREDRALIREMLIKARSRPHFFQFILIGGTERDEEYLQGLNRNLRGPGIDNVGLTIYRDMPPSDDAAFFNDVIREFFLSWLPEARTRKITKR